MDPAFEQQIPFIPIAIAFVALLLLTRVLRRKLRQRYLRQEGQIDTGSGRIPTIEERVAANRSWARGEIVSKGRWFVGAAWLLALVWNLTFGVSFIKGFSNPEMKTGGLVVLGIFSLGGLAAIAFAVRLTLRQLRFGESVCRINGKVGVLGKGITGTIRSKIDIKPEGDYSVLLQCVESYHVGTGKNRTSKTEIHWQGKQTIPRAGTSSRMGIPFSIDIPGYPPETGYQISRGPITWQLSITAPTAGVDYAAMFVVPVFKVE